MHNCWYTTCFFLPTKPTNSLIKIQVSIPSIKSTSSIHISTYPFIGRRSFPPYTFGCGIRLTLTLFLKWKFPHPNLKTNQQLEEQVMKLCHVLTQRDFRNFMSAGRKEVLNRYQHKDQSNDIHRRGKSMKRVVGNSFK